MGTPGRGQGATAAQSGLSRGSEALQKLKCGEMTLDEYLDDRVARALAKIGGLVSDEQRQFLREMIREQLLTDPVLSEYVRRATGRDLPPPLIR